MQTVYTLCQGVFVNVYAYELVYATACLHWQPVNVNMFVSLCARAVCVYMRVSVFMRCVPHSHQHSHERTPPARTWPWSLVLGWLRGWSRSLSAGSHHCRDTEEENRRWRRRRNVQQDRLRGKQISARFRGISDWFQNVRYCSLHLQEVVWQISQKKSCSCYACDKSSLQITVTQSPLAALAFANIS